VRELPMLGRDPNGLLSQTQRDSTNGDQVPRGRDVLKPQRIMVSDPNRLLAREATDPRRLDFEDVRRARRAEDS
jgi:hypothetical protein